MHILSLFTIVPNTPTADGFPSPLSSLIPVLYLYYIIIFLHHFYLAAVSIKISNLLICFRWFDFSCPVLEKENVIESLYIVLFWFIK